MSGPNNINRIGGLVDPIGHPSPAAPGAKPAGTPGQFSRVLAEQARSGLSPNMTFSNHALQRLDRRDLAPSLSQLNRLQDSVDLAQRKGSRSAVVLVDDLAFVVAVPARTVITAIDREHMKEQIFTNIDAAVIG